MEERFIIDPNLLYHYIELFRSIALYGEINFKSLLVVSITTIVLVIMSLIIYKKVNKKLIFWIS